MVDVIVGALKGGRRVGGSPILECWLYLGQPFDYQHAENDYVTGLSAGA